MNDQQNYLDHHYQTLEQFANLCAISPEELNNLISQQLIPSPSYTVTSSNKCISQAFGELTASDLSVGKYFHPGNKSWVIIAIETKNRVGSAQARINLKEQFRQNFAAELKSLNNQLFPLQDSFTNNGQIIEEGLNARTNAAWVHFLKGVFSLCVADPSTEKSIATKEVLQEALIALTENGVKTDFNTEDKNHILNLINQYEQAAMPFSPAEYPMSSRKRLVEDLRAKLVTYMPITNIKS
jgi:hypothetical protein